jgi:chromosome partitioning protein
MMPKVIAVLASLRLCVERAMTPRVIAVLNFKGGTGKTTTVVNLSAGLARAGRRVLAIDLDPQGGLASSLGITPAVSLANLLLGQATPRQVIVQARPGLDIIPSTPQLAGVERALWRFSSTQQSATPRLLAQRLQAFDDYDYVLLDCSPSLCYMNESALLCAREVLVPASMDYLSLVGIKQVLDLIQVTGRSYDHPIEVSLILPTFYDRRQRKSQEVMAILRQHFPDKLADPVRYNVRLSEAPSYQEHIYEYDPRSIGAQDYTRLVARVMNGG